MYFKERKTDEFNKLYYEWLSSNDDVDPLDIDIICECKDCLLKKIVENQSKDT